MEVKPGYKLTEIGVIPDDWRIKQLKDMFDIRAGGDYQPKHSSLYENDEFRYPIYANALTNKGLYGFADYFTDDYNSITVTARGKLGYSVYRDHPYVSIGRLLTLHPHNKEVNGVFYAEYLNQYVNFIQESTGVPQLTSPQIGLVVVPLPPKEEQESISRMLTDIVSLITSLEKLIDKKKNIKQGVMQELLTGKRRLQGFDKGWETKKLNSLCSCITTGRKDVNEGNPNGKYPFFTCSRSITFSDQYSFDSEAILIAGNGDVGTLHYYKGKFEAYQRTYVLSGFGIPAKYLVHYLNYSLIPALNENKIGSSIPYIKIGDLTDLLINTPREQSEISAIVNVLDDMDCEIGALSLQLEKCKNLKDGMMQELLTGRIRLL
jgi:type I restriction enzyme S subunit